MVQAELTSSEMPAPSAVAGRFVRGVDTLRLWAALWVAFSHGAYFPVDAYINPADGLWQTIAVGLSKMAFNGTAAVVVFFVISGFCIHFPNVEKSSINWLLFLKKRGVRIGLPLVAIIAVTFAVGDVYRKALDSVLWSIYCEIIYYALYPLLFIVIRRFGIGPVLLYSAMPSLAILLRKPDMIYLWEPDWSLTWLLCLPMWLIGAALAQFHRAGGRIPLPGWIWVWRGGAVFACLATTVVAHHLPGIHIGYVWSMPIAAIYCFAWLGMEFRRYEKYPPIGFLEAAGAAGYSIYLVHRPVIEFFTLHMADLAPLQIWSLQLTAIVLLSGVFYLAVERPAHRLARSIS